MTERQQLLALAGLLYVAECVRWVRRGAVVLAAAPERRAWRRSPLMGNERGDAFIGWPLPPFGEFLVVRGRPFSAGETGVVTVTAASLHAAGRPVQPARLWSWQQAATARAAGDKVMVGRDVAWTADSPFEASQLAAWLARRGGLGAEERVAALAQDAAGSLDGEAIRARLVEWRATLRPLRLVQAGLFAWLFGVLPAAVWWWGWFPTLAWAVPPVVGASVWLSWRFRRILAGWHPEERDERARVGLMLALSPLTALRASELAGRTRFAWFHPAAVAAAYLPRAEAEALASALWRDLKHPRQPAPTTDQEMAAVVEAERLRTMAAMGDWARREGWDPAAWDRPPVATDGLHERYCPRCLAQFTARAESCGECGGLGLVALQAKAETRHVAKG